MSSVRKMITVCIHLPNDLKPAAANLPAMARRVGPFSKWNEGRNFEYDALTRAEADLVVAQYVNDPGLGVIAHIKGEV